MLYFCFNCFKVSYCFCEARGNLSVLQFFLSGSLKGIISTCQSGECRRLPFSQLAQCQSATAHQMHLTCSECRSRAYDSHGTELPSLVCASADKLLFSAVGGAGLGCWNFCHVESQDGLVELLKCIPKERSVLVLDWDLPGVHVQPQASFEFRICYPKSSELFRRQCLEWYCFTS